MGESNGAIEVVSEKSEDGEERGHIFSRVFASPMDPDQAVEQNQNWLDLFDLAVEGVYPAVVREIDATHASDVDGAVVGTPAGESGKPPVQPGFAVFLIDYENRTLLGSEPVQERPAGGDCPCQLQDEPCLGSAGVAGQAHDPSSGQKGFDQP
jgi:hypothetical protein